MEPLDTPAYLTLIRREAPGHTSLAKLSKCIAFAAALFVLTLLVVSSHFHISTSGNLLNHAVQKLIFPWKARYALSEVSMKPAPISRPDLQVLLSGSSPQGLGALSQIGLSKTDCN